MVAVVDKKRDAVLKQAGIRLTRAFARFCLEKNDKKARAAYRKELRAIFRELTIDKLDKDSIG